MIFHNKISRAVCVRQQSTAFKDITRKLPILLFFITGFVMATEFPESFVAVSEKVELVGFGKLNDKERAIYAIWWLEAEVNNGGFHQYFWNAAGDHTDVALKSLNAIGATETASLLQQAIVIAFDGHLPQSQEERQKRLETDEEAKMDKLSELDSNFYGYSEDFHKMLDAYLAN